MQITTEGKYRTRDGRAVRILAIIRSENWPVVGVITNADGTETAEAWTKDGDCLITHDNNGLISIPTKHEGWMALHICNTPESLPVGPVYVTKESAAARRDRNHTIDNLGGFPTRRMIIAHVTWED